MASGIIREPFAADLEEWLTELQQHFVAVAPELLYLFDTYASEARFGYDYIIEDLSQLPQEAVILEVGAGSFILSCYLAHKGFRMTGLEPVSDGFSHFTKMSHLVLERARIGGFSPFTLQITGEELTIQNTFDYAFSINVMEHVTSVEKTLSNVVSSLKPGGIYRFTCPNYSFPYEPHFNIPTLFSKVLTERILGKMVFNTLSVSDPVGLWTSLNWITVSKLRRFANNQNGIRILFTKDLIVKTFERVGNDPIFAARRSPLVQKLLKLFVRYNIHTWFGLLPVTVLPIIDCRVNRNAEREL